MLAETSFLGPVLPYKKLCLLLYLLPLFLSAEADLQALLKSYVGTWSGKYTVHSTATGFTEAFEVQQQYWLEDGKLYGVSVMIRDEGMRSANSVTVLHENYYYSVVKRAEVEEEYLGVPKDGGILWVPRNMGRATDYQIREWVEQSDGTRRLKTEGFDTYVFAEGIAHLVYKGDLLEVEDP